jgi:hypothetical protein
MKSPKLLPLWLSLFLALLACETETSLNFEPMIITEGNCTECAEVIIEVPKALGDAKIVQTINTAIREELISILHFDDSLAVADVDSAIDSFRRGYEVLKEKFTEETMPWEATIRGTVAYENANILTITLDSYLFTGGAHGYSEVRYLNFDKEQALEVENEALFKNLEEFTTFAEAQFRREENIPANASINSTGFMFETESFYLPQSIGYTEQGIQLFYAPYEIASYADGPIVLTLPFESCNTYLVWPSKS